MKNVVVLLLPICFCVTIVASLADEILSKILALPPENSKTLQPEHCALFGGDWTFDGQGTAEVHGNSGNVGPKLVCTNTKFTNLTKGTVSIEMFFPALPPNHPQGYRNAGLLVKVNNPGIGADAFTGYEIGLCPEESHINLGFHQQNYRPIQRIPCKIPVERWFTLQIVFDDTSFDVRIDGKTAATYTVRTLADQPNMIRSGGVGLRSWNRSVRYRNWTIAVGNETFSVPLTLPPQSDEPAIYPASLATESLPPILFMTRHPLTQPNSVGNDIWMAQPTAPGCSLRLMNPADPNQPIKTLFSDPEGSLYDMNLSADAKKVFFSYRRKGEIYWHLWELQLNDLSLRQLTSGPFHDISPCEAPDGSLVFVSTRRFGYTVCQPGAASNLHRLTWKEGKPMISCISMNTLSDMSPQMLPDGRILFTRWEYIDRDLTFRQSLWTQNPDGTGYQLFFGNTIRDVGTFWQARPVPRQSGADATSSSGLVVATFAPHHGYPHGMVGLINRSAGIEGKKGEGFTYITKELPTVGDTNLPWGYRDPYPLSEETFLCSYGDGSGFYRDGKKRFALYLLNRQGEKRLLFEDQEQSCFFPIPLKENRSKIVVSDKVSATVPEQLHIAEAPLTGTVLLLDVNEGLQGKVQPGTIKALRILEQIRKTEDLTNRAYDQSPVMSYGTYYAKRDWGTVPLEKDGSAHFVVPALREIYLQGLDEQGREVFRMTSALQVMPGEHTSCVGCHEDRDSAPIAFKRIPLAAAKPPVLPKRPDWLMNRSRLNSFPDAAVFDYPSTVQPVLDRHCVQCHNGTNAEGGYDLTGHKTRFFSMSYDNLLGTSRSYRQHDMTTGKMLPEESAKGKPLVHFFWLLFTPTAINEPYITGSHASRLTELIESNHGSVTMPLEDRQILYYWMDANVPYYGTYAHSRPNSPGRRDRFADPRSGRYSSWYADRFLDVYRRRCAECHQSFEQPDNRDWIGRYAWINLDKPQQSAALTAHLAKDQGGRGIAAIKGNKRTLADSPQQLLFYDTAESDYVQMLSAIEEGKRMMLEHPEADMPLFQKARPEP